MPDARVSDEREAHSQREYNELFKAIETMKDRALAAEPETGSVLERDDANSGIIPLSWQVKWQLQLVAAYLTALDDLIETRGLPYVAGYPLIRAAVESAGQAHWLLQHGHSHQRVLRALRTSWWDHRDAMRFSKSVGAYEAESDQKIRGTLLELRDGVKPLRQSELDTERLSHTDMLTDVGRKLRLPMPTPLQAWQLASAMTHGNTLVPGSTLQRTVIDPERPELHFAYGSWHLTVPLIRTAVSTSEAALKLLQDRGVQPV